MAEFATLVERIERLLPKHPSEALEGCRELRGIALEKRKYDLFAWEEGLRGRGYLAVKDERLGRETVAGVLQWYRQRNLADRGSLLMNAVGADYYQLREYPKARIWLASAVRSAADAGAPEVLCKALFNLGRTDQQEGFLPSSRSYLEHALRVSQQVASAPGRVQICFALGEVSMKLGSLREAEGMFRAAGQLARNRQEWKAALQAAGSLAELLCRQHRWEEAKALSEQSAAAARSRGMELQLLLSLSSLTRVLVHLGEGEAAMSTGLEAVRRAESSGVGKRHPEVLEVYKYLAIASRNLYTDQEGAYRWYVKYRNALDGCHG